MTQDKTFGHCPLSGGTGKCIPVIETGNSPLGSALRAKRLYLPSASSSPNITHNL